jgi:type IV pilus assembly protein PilM
LINTAAARVGGRTGFLSGIDRWLNVMRHPAHVVEIGAVHVAAAQWDGPKLQSYAVETLEAGALMPSPVETNVTQPESVRRALQRVFARLGGMSGPVALLLPDPVVRVFILDFDELPRRAEDALPLLRWRLKKSVPFDVEETTVSWTRQTARDGSLEIVAAVARQGIVREYESLLHGFELEPKVVLSSTLATLPLVSENGSTLLMRMNGHTLTTAIVRGTTVCLYRSTEMPAAVTQLDPRFVVEEVFPAAAYFQDSWGESIDRALLAGFVGRQDVFQSAVENELKIPVRPVASGDRAAEFDRGAQELMQQGLDPLVGWMANEGA